MIYWILKIFFSPVIYFFWINKVKGITNIPKSGSFIVASNHNSYFDFICLVSIFPRRIYFLAAEVFFKKPLWRILMKLTGQIKIDRKSKDKSESLRKVSSLLRSGKVICIFPEGTRSSTGRINKAFLGVSRLALENSVGILPIGLSGTYNILSRHDNVPSFERCDISIGNLLSYNKINKYYKENDIDFLTHCIVMKEIAQLSNQSYDYCYEENSNI